MGVLFLAVALILINVGFWAVFLAKFKKLFSTEDIISSVRNEMNHMIADMQRNTSLNVDLIDSRIKELKAITAEADRHLAVARSELERQEQTKAYQHHMNTLTQTPHTPQERRGNPSASRDYAKASSDGRGNYSQRSAQSYMKAAQSTPSLFGEQSVALTRQGQEALSKQGDLFADSVALDVPKPQTFTVQKDGASYAAVPVIGPEVSFAENPITSKKDFTSQVKDLARVGQSVEEIASTLGRSIQEVQFALDMGF